MGCNESSSTSNQKPQSQSSQDSSQQKQPAGQGKGQTGSKDGFYSLEEIRVKIQENESKIKEAQAKESERMPLPHKGNEFPEENFINFTVYSEESQEDIQLNTFLYPTDNPKGVIYFFHGLGGYVNAFAHVPKFFASKGFVTVGYDYRSHGTSGGKSMEDFATCVEDSKKFMSMADEYLSTKYSPEILKTRFVWGVSMGGMMSFEVTRQSPEKFNGVMLMCPAFELMGSDEERNMVIDYANQNPYGTFPMGENTISKNPEVWDHKDPIMIEKGPPLVNCKILIDQTRNAKNYWADYSCKFVQVIPGMDKTVPPRAQLQFFETAKSQDKTVWYYETNWHMLVWEKEIIEINNRLWEWMQKRM